MMFLLLNNSSGNSLGKFRKIFESFEFKLKLKGEKKAQKFPSLTKFPFILQNPLPPHPPSGDSENRALQT